MKVRDPGKKHQFLFHDGNKDHSISNIKYQISNIMQRNGRWPNGGCEIDNVYACCDNGGRLPLGVCECAGSSAFLWDKYNDVCVVHTVYTYIIINVNASLIMMHVHHELSINNNPLYTLIINATQ